MKRFGRPRDPNRPRLLQGIHPVPTLVTLGNLLCGFGAIVLCMRASNPPTEFYGMNGNDCLRVAGLLVFVAMIFDAMDGKVARLTKSTSKFGMEMDSLCDVVSFGVAPAVLVKALIDQHLGSTTPFPILDRYVWPMLAVYVCCAALRLARYNVEAEKSGHSDFFFGMPSPGAAGCAASLCLLIIPSRHVPALNPLQSHISQLDNLRDALHWPLLLAMPFIMLGLGVLMVSRVHYPHVGDRLLRGRKSIFHILVLGLALILLSVHHEIFLALVFNGFMLLGLFNELRYQFVPSSRPPGWENVPGEIVPTPETGKTQSSASLPAAPGSDASNESRSA